VPASAPHQLRFAPFKGADAVDAGLLSRRQLAGPAWRRLYRDVYAHAGLALDHRALCHAAGLHLAGRGAVSGLSGAYLWGADVLARSAPVEVTVPAGVRLRGQDELVVIRSALPDADVTSIAGTPVTTPLRTAFDVGRRHPLEEAVAGLDALLGRRPISVWDVRRFAACRPAWPGSRQLRRALSLVDTGAESVMESRLRLVLVLGGLPRPVAQYEVFDKAGFFVARLDLAYPQQRLGIEYEGDHHRGRGVFAHDLRRTNALHALGWHILRFGADDVLRHPARIVAQVRAVLYS
jgi:very-short-patch-repair endonuclease